MFGWDIWVPPSTAGTSIEIPARAPGSPANLWIHFAMNATEWSGFPSEGVSQGDWSRSTIMAEVFVEPGDIPVASVCCIGLAGIHREQQGIFDSSTWGAALDSMAPVAPGALQFSGGFATAGKSWPGGIWLLADVLVLRPSLIPPVPLPYGTYPPPSPHWIWPFQKYVQLIGNIQHLTSDQLTLLRRLNLELQDLLASYDLRKTEASQRPVTRPAKLSLKIATPASATGGLTANVGSMPPKKAAKPKAGESEKRKRSAPRRGSRR
jgi:hypothetical protein